MEAAYRELFIRDSAYRELFIRGKKSRGKCPDTLFAYIPGPGWTWSKSNNLHLWFKSFRVVIYIN